MVQGGYLQKFRRKVRLNMIDLSKIKNTYIDKQLPYIFLFIFIIVVIFINTVSKPNTNERDYIIPNKVKESYFNQFILDKTPNRDFEREILSYYKLESGTFYLVPELKEEEKAVLIGNLKDIGYYTRLENRLIATQQDKIFSGYLGHSFKLKYFGVLAWLALPIAMWKIIGFKKLKRWEQAYIFIYITSTLVITFYGYDNSRYQLTHAFFSLPLTMYVLRNVFSRLDSANKLITILLIPILLLVFYKISNTKLLWARTFGKFVQTQTALQLDYVNLVDNISLEKDECVLVNNNYALYYYTDNPYLYYWGHKDIYFDGKGAQRLLSEKTNDEVAEKLKNELNCPYIFSRNDFLDYNLRLKTFIEQKTEVVGRSEKYSIYKVIN